MTHHTNDLHPLASSTTAALKITVLGIWHASGIIENGGFQYFFEQELDAEAVADAYGRIGCDKCAELLRLGLSLFPDSVIHASWSDHVQYMERNSETFSNLSSAFWVADKEMENHLAEYIRTHAGKLCSPP